MRIIGIGIVVLVSLYGMYCQVKLRDHISREKVMSLKDLKVLARGGLPPKEILDDEGLKYHRRFLFAVGLAVVTTLALLVLGITGEG